LDKISSILPSNARIKSVDLEGSQAARPGAPTLGRHEGISTVKDRVSLSEAARGQALRDSFKETLGGARAKDAARAKMVAEMTRNFFDNRVKTVAEPEPVSEGIAESTMQSAEEFAPQKEVGKDSLRESMIAKYSSPAESSPRETAVAEEVPSSAAVTE
jgi:hypothetical protein